MNVCYNCVIWCNMGAHHPAELSLSLVTYGLRLEVYDEARPKHWTSSVDPIVWASHSTICHHYSRILLWMCMMWQDPSERWLPEVVHWVQLSSWASHSTICHHYSRHLIQNG